MRDTAPPGPSGRRAAEPASSGARRRPSTVYLGLGSNVGDRVAHLRYALRRLAAGVGRVAAVSSVYETDPVGYVDQPRFLNRVARVETELEPGRLLEAVRGIEQERGRERAFKNAPRTLDIDILLYDDRRVDRPGLTIPHPRMTQRAFVLVPLLELDPDLVEPGTGTRYDEYLGSQPAGIRRVAADDGRLEGD